MIVAEAIEVVAELDTQSVSNRLSELVLSTRAIAGVRLNQAVRDATASAGGPAAMLYPQLRDAPVMHAHAR